MEEEIFRQMTRAGNRKNPPYALWKGVSWPFPLEPPTKFGSNRSWYSPFQVSPGGKKNAPFRLKRVSASLGSTFCPYLH